MNSHDIEQAIAQLIPKPLLSNDNNKPTGTPNTASKPFDDSIYPRISSLLELAGKSTWALRPRTYTVLRLIDRLDTLDAFINDGLYDISLPFTIDNLPFSLSNSNARVQFIEAQRLVLSAQAADVESGQGRHRHFAIDGDNYFARIKILGRGGFGEVDHVWSRLSRNQFARKRVLRGRTFAKDRAAISSFENELEVLKRLSHHHLVKYMGSYSDPKYIGLIISPVADSNLDEFLNASPITTANRASLQRYLGCLTSAVLYLHDNQIRHKDIKPSNVLIHCGNVLVTDFGTSLDWKDQGSSTTDNQPMAFTPRYCAPEVLNWQPRNSSSDIYSLGLIFVEIVSVLKGKTVPEMELFWKANSPNRQYGVFFVQHHPKIIEKWIDHLSSIPGSQREHEPLKWTQAMLQFSPTERPTAAALMETIRTCGLVEYVGSCCVGDDDGASGDSSYAGSDVEEDLTGELEAIRYLRERQLDITNWNFDKGPWLRWATGEANLAMVKLLLKKDAYVDAHDADGQTSLHKAANKGHQQLVKILLDANANVNAQAGGKWTALHYACRGGFGSVVKLLLKKKADVKSRTNTEWTALHWAAKCGFDEIVVQLLENGADPAAVDKFGHTPLHLASREGHAGTILVLVERGADVAARDKNGRTALQWAQSNWRTDAIKVLTSIR